MLGKIIVTSGAYVDSVPKRPAWALTPHALYRIDWLLRWGYEPEGRYQRKLVGAWKEVGVETIVDLDRSRSCFRRS